MRGGDQAFTAFVDACSAALMRFAYLLAPQPAHAQDLLQAALLRTYLRWSRVRDNPDAYVRRVLVTVAADERRRPWRREVTTAQPPEPTLAYDPTAAIDDVDELRRALAGLPARQRAAVVLHYHEGLSAAQTADLLGCSEGTVRSQATRGLDKLRVALATDSQEIGTGGDHD